MSNDSLLLNTKISPTTNSLATLQRPHLIDKINELPSGSTLLVTAPCGYGKSTLLSQWQQQAHDKTCAWFSADGNDDPHRVLNHVIHAFCQHGVDLATTESLANKTVKEKLEVLFSALEQHNNALCVIFDNCHLAAPSVVEQIYAFFLNWAPTTLTLIFSSQRELELNFAKKALNGLLYELDSTQLNFNAEEITRLTAFDDQVTSQIIEQFSAGWPALVQLIKVSEIEISQSDEQQPIGISKRCRHYLEHILSTSLEAQQIQLLMEASVFNSIPIDFFRLNKNGSFTTDVIDDLRPFVVPSNKIKSELTMHPLFRALLSRRLKSTALDKWVFLQTQAANWFVNTGQGLNAIHHAMETQDRAFIEQVLFQLGGPNWLMFQHLSTLVSVRRMLSDCRANGSQLDLATYPLLYLTNVFIQIKTGKITQAHKAFSALASQYANEQTAPDKVKGQKKQITEWSFALTRVCLNYYSMRPITTTKVERLTKFNRSAISSIPLLQASIWTTQALLAYQNNSYKTATTHAQRAIEAFKYENTTAGEAHALLIRAHAECAMGDHEKGRNSLQEVERRFGKHIEDNPELHFAFNVLSTEMHLHANPFREGELHNFVVDFLDALHRLHCWFDYIACASLQIIDNLHLQDRPERVRAFITKATNIVTARAYPRLTRFFNTLMAYHYAKIGDETSALTVIATESTMIGGSTLTGREERVVTELLILLNRMTPFAVEKELTKRQKSGDISTQLRLILALAQCAFTQGKTQNAMNSVHRACELILAHSQLREAAVYQSLFDHLSVLYPPTAPSSSSEKQYNLAQVLHRLEHAKCSVSTWLTKQEQLVMAELKDGLSNKRIARNLGISPNTVNFHLKNIYRKLRVSNRADAVTAATSHQY